MQMRGQRTLGNCFGNYVLQKNWQINTNANGSNLVDLNGGGEKIGAIELEKYGRNVGGNFSEQNSDGRNWNAELNGNPIWWID